MTEPTFEATMRAEFKQAALRKSEAATDRDRTELYRFVYDVIDNLQWHEGADDPCPEAFIVACDLYVLLDELDARANDDIAATNGWWDFPNGGRDAFLNRIGVPT